MMKFPLRIHGRLLENTSESFVQVPEESCLISKSDDSSSTAKVSSKRGLRDGPPTLETSRAWANSVTGDRALCASCESETARRLGTVYSNASTWAEGLLEIEAETWDVS